MPSVGVTMTNAKESQLKPPYPLILDALLRGRVIPFLGAGASLDNNTLDGKWKETAECFPNATQLAQHLAEKTEFPIGESQELTKVAQYYSVVGGRQILEEALHRIFGLSFKLSSLHSFLADLPVPLLIVTTNYDDLIERAFQEKNRPYDVVIHTTQPKLGNRLLWWKHGESKPREVMPNKVDIDLGTTTVIYKMHGAVDNHDPKRDQYVITEDDYIDFLTRMTKSKAIPTIFGDPFQTRHVLFLGYGLHDWNMRVVLNRIDKDLARPKGIKSWVIEHNPSPLEKRFWQERGVEMYEMAIEDFVKELEAHKA